MEYAAKLGTCSLLRKILYTQGVYVTRKVVRGATVYRWHDVTEYENGIRTCKSPLSFLATLDDQAFMDISTTVMLRSNLYKNWSNRKIRSVKFPAFLWFIVRLVYISLFFSLYRDTSYTSHFFQKGHELLRLNITIAGPTLPDENPVCPAVLDEMPNTTRNTIISVLIACTSVFIIGDVIDLIRALRNGVMCYFRVHTTFRGAQFLVNIVALTLAPVLIYEVEDYGESLHIYYAITRSTMPIACAWSLLYFALFIPSIGFAVLSIQKMLKDAFRFGFIYIVILLPFQQAFQTFVNSYSKTGCQEDFRDDWSSLFTLYLTTFFIVDPRQYDVNYVGVFRLLFVLFTFVVAVVLLNFLIAIMSHTANRIKLDTEIIVDLNKLTIANTIDMRFSLFKNLLSLWKRLFFVNKVVDGKRRYYVISTEARLAV